VLHDAYWCMDGKRRGYCAAASAWNQGPYIVRTMLFVGPKPSDGGSRMGRQEAMGRSRLWTAATPPRQRKLAPPYAIEDLTG